jgi:hypothetical protein
MCSLEFYAPDGEHVVEGEFDTVEEAIERWNDIGSRWVFYPIGVIFASPGRVTRVKVAPSGFEYLQGLYRKTFEQAIKDGEFDE